MAQGYNPDGWSFNSTPLVLRAAERKLTPSWSFNGELIKVARGSKPRTDSGTVILPGDKSVALRREALATGMVEVSDAILEKLKGLL